MNKWKTESGIQIDQILRGRSNSFLISNNDKCILVDTGPQSSWRALERRLDTIIPKKGSLIALVLTHVHYDHFENSQKIKDKYGPEIIVHESEALFLSNGKNAPFHGAIPITRFFYNLVNGGKLITMLNFAPAAYDVVVNEEYKLNDLGFNAYILHTPGHSRGSMSVIVDHEIAIVGDAMFGVFNNSVMPPWAEDTKIMINSWKKLLDTGCNLFLPGHGTSNSKELLQKQYIKYKDRLS